MRDFGREVVPKLGAIGYLAQFREQQRGDDELEVPLHPPTQQRGGGGLIRDECGDKHARIGDDPKHYSPARWARTSSVARLSASSGSTCAAWDETRSSRSMPRNCRRARSITSESFRSLRAANTRAERST